MRQPGFYFVKFHGEWIIGEYKEQIWFVIGCDEMFCESEFDEIGGKITMPS